MNNTIENYGDEHLHYSGYPVGQCPHKCGKAVNYEHANLCDSVPYGTVNPGVQYRTGDAYDCGCNLCQSPYSVPYAPGAGGHLGDMLQYKPCKNPYCRCTDCDGNCKCAAAAVVEKFGVMGDNSLMNLTLLLLIAALLYFLYKK